MKKFKPTPAGTVLAAVSLVIALALVPAALAGKGGGKPSSGGSGTVTGPVMVVDNNSNGSPNWGDSVTFKVSTSASWPSVELDCSQNGTVVYEQVTGFYPTYMWSNNYTLKGFYWTSGAASCTATLYNTNRNGSNTTLATMSFSVGA